jgi:hypothetical protein
MKIFPQFSIAGNQLYTKTAKFLPHKNFPQYSITSVIWYFDPGVDFSSLYFEPPHGKLTLLISTKREGFTIP